jgi:GT2 family glycosyltransferase
MGVSVVVNIHSGTDPEMLGQSLESLRRQTYDKVEVVIAASAVDTGRYDLDGARVVELEEDRGLSHARNAGAERAEGEIVAFTDDDVVADEDWIAELVRIYEATDAVGVGGSVSPIWPSDPPWYLPDEFLWLVGAMHDSFGGDEPQPVRNTFGCNISFRRDAFLEAGGFDESLGKDGTPLQGEEADLCSRIDGEFWYNPAAHVRHHVDSSQLDLGYLLNRSFWQGFSKAGQDDMGDEGSFLRDLFAEAIPRRLRRPTPGNIGETAVLLGLTGAVGTGFIYGRVRR